MSTLAKSELSQFALDVDEGLSASGQKLLSPRYLYDALGSALFEAITLLPEYGLTRADERLLKEHASEIAYEVGNVGCVAELGSGSGSKTAHILKALRRNQSMLVYRPIDVSAAALEMCGRSIGGIATCKPLLGEWLEALSELATTRHCGSPLLLLFLGSSIGNLDRDGIIGFLQQIRSYLRTGDTFLVGADLVKNTETMLTAYDDPTGVTAAFNLNVLGRMNRELGANFDLRAFAHEARWNDRQQRIEMHLLSGRGQTVTVEALGKSFGFCAGETIWTESSHKFNVGELNRYAAASGFSTIQTWIDTEWPFAETLWRA